MSRIYFHTPERTVEVRGSERAYMGVLASDIALSVIRVRLDGLEGLEWARSVTAANRDVFSRPDWWRKDWETWFRVGWHEGDGVRITGEVLDTTDLALNTLIATRSPALTLLAKLHGTCEDHAWIDTADAEWFAGLIEEGRTENILRADQGWESVAELAREVASGLRGPIVTSYSVTDGFPNAYVAEWEPPTCDACGGDGKPNPRMKYQDVEYDYCTTCGGEGALSDLWYDLPAGEQWRLAETGMRARRYNRQIAPETMGEGFMSGKSAFDLMAEDSARVS